MQTQPLDTSECATTIGIDVSDKYSRVCVLDGSGAVVEEGRLATTGPAFRRRFSTAPRARRKAATTCRLVCRAVTVWWALTIVRARGTLQRWIRTASVAHAWRRGDRERHHCRHPVSGHGIGLADRRLPHRLRCKREGPFDAALVRTRSHCHAVARTARPRRAAATSARP
jgi:hypothetical protein